MLESQNRHLTWADEQPRTGKGDVWPQLMLAVLLNVNYSCYLVLRLSRHYGVQVIADRACLGFLFFCVVILSLLLFGFVSPIQLAVHGCSSARFGVERAHGPQSCHAASGLHGLLTDAGSCFSQCKGAE